MTRDILKLVQELARQAAPDESEVAHALGAIPPTELLQVAAFAEQVYALFARGSGPAWADLEASLRSSFVLQVESKLWPKAKPFETLVARLAIDMMRKRKRFLSALLASGSLDNPLARVHARHEQDEAQFEMNDSVDALEHTLSRYHTERAAARMGQDQHDQDRNEEDSDPDRRPRDSSGDRPG